MQKIFSVLLNKQIATLGAGTYFGEDEILLNIPRRTQAITTQKSGILIINKDVFFKNLKNKYNV